MKAKQILVAILASLALILVLVPVVALADEDTAGGQFTAGNEAPDVTAIALNVGGGSSTSSMTPQAASGYDVVVTVADANTVNDTAVVKVTIFYDTDADNDPSDAPTSGDNQDVAILTWTKSTGLWTIDAGSETPQTWSIDSGNCTLPTMTDPSGDWTFRFTPGKVAREHASEWDIYATATDAASGSDSLYDSSGYAMDWYGELAIDLDTIDFGNVAPGATDNASPNFVLTSIANGSYQLELKSSATWTGPATLNLDVIDENPGDAELALEADHDADEIGAQLITDAYVDYTGHSTDTGPTVEAGATVATNTLWLTLGSTGIPSGDYSGTIHYQILTD